MFSRQMKKYIVYGILIFIFLFICVGIPLLVINLDNEKTDPSVQNDKIEGDLTNRDREQNLNALKNIDALFGVPFSLNPVTPGITEFGKNVFVHDTGFIAISCVSNGITKLLLYQTTDYNILKVKEELSIPTSISVQPSATPVIVSGTFMPSFGSIGEVYYLLITIGITDQIDLYGREIHLYYYNTNPTPDDITNPSPLTWVYQPLFVLKNPYYTTSSYLSTIIPLYVACFGNKIQAVLDDNSPEAVRQSLYVSTTDFDSYIQPTGSPLLYRRQPTAGGGVFWFVFLSNTINPKINIEYIIQDSKLLYLSGVPGSTVLIPLLLPEKTYYMRGFGSEFYVQSGSGSSNRLAIANLTNQDTQEVTKKLCTNGYNASAPNGYIQVYESNNQSSLQPGWIQVNQNCDENPDIKVYVNRFWPNTIVDPDVKGFGSGLLITDNFLLVTSSSNETSIPPFDNYVFSYNLSTDIPPTTNQKPSIVGQITFSEQQIATQPTFPSVTFNRNLFFVGQLLCVTSYYTDPNQDVAALFKVFNSSGTPGISPVVERFTDFGNAVELFGHKMKKDDQEIIINSGMGTKSFDGFSQWAYSWQTPNKLNRFLLFNDPLYINDNQSTGRVLIYEQNV
jgi:hypothetical protein